MGETMIEELDPEKMYHWMGFARLMGVLTGKRFSWSVNPRYRTVKVHINGR
jgi:hypothetical protein